MKGLKGILRASVLPAAGAMVAMAAAAPGVAQVVVEAPFARPSLGAARNSAAYMTLRNLSARGDALVAAQGDVAERVELHTHIRREDGGRVIMQMRPVKKVPLPAGGEVRLAPGGYHIMLIGVKRRLRPGMSFPLHLVFEKALPVDVLVPVKKLGHAMHGGMTMPGMTMSGKKKD